MNVFQNALAASKAIAAAATTPSNCTHNIEGVRTVLLAAAEKAQGAFNSENIEVIRVGLVETASKAKEAINPATIDTIRAGLEGAANQVTSPEAWCFLDVCGHAWLTDPNFTTADCRVYISQPQVCSFASSWRSLCRCSHGRCWACYGRGWMVSYRPCGR